MVSIRIKFFSTCVVRVIRITGFNRLLNVIGRYTLIPTYKYTSTVEIFINVSFISCKSVTLPDALL